MDEKYIVIDGGGWGMPGYYYQMGNGVYDEPAGPFDSHEEAEAEAEAEVKRQNS